MIYDMGKTWRRDTDDVKYTYRHSSELRFKCKCEWCRNVDRRKAIDKVHKDEINNFLTN